MEKLTVSTPDQTIMLDITNKINEIVAKNGISSGICYIFVPHTTAALTINENADPDVRVDITKELDTIVPFADNYKHGEGNSAAHIKASMIGSSESIIIEDGRLQLGTWQGIFLCEFDGPRRRQVWIKLVSLNNHL
jgi:secondary thiamine-phosphate synthase enzyme